MCILCLQAVQASNEIVLTLTVLLKQHSENSLSSPVLSCCVDRISKDNVTSLDQRSAFGVLQLARVSQAPFVRAGEKQQSERARASVLCRKVSEIASRACYCCVPLYGCSGLWAGAYF